MGAIKQSTLRPIRTELVPTVCVDLFDTALRIALDHGTIEVGPRPVRSSDPLFMPARTHHVPQRLVKLHAFFRFHCGISQASKIHAAFELRSLALIDVVRGRNVSDWIHNTAEGSVLEPDLIEATAEERLPVGGAFTVGELFERAAGIEWEDTFGRLKRLSSLEE